MVDSKENYKFDLGVKGLFASYMRGSLLSSYFSRRLTDDSFHLIVNKGEITKAGCRTRGWERKRNNSVQTWHLKKRGEQGQGRHRPEGSGDREGYRRREDNMERRKARRKV